MDPLREQALACIDIVLDRIKTVIATAEAWKALETSWKARGSFGETALAEAGEAFDKASADFEAQGPVVEALTVYLEGRGYEDADLCFEDAAGTRHVHAAGIRTLYFALDNRVRLGQSQSHILGFVRQLEQALLKARSFCSDSDEEKSPYTLTPPNHFRWLDGEEIRLSILEYKLLAFCLEHRRANTQDVIDAVWGHDSDRNIDNLHSLKSKVIRKLTGGAVPVDLEVSKGSQYLVTTVTP